MICQNVRHGVAYRSKLASTWLRSIPAMRARTSRITRLMLNSVRAPTIVW